MFVRIDTFVGYTSDMALFLSKIYYIININRNMVVKSIIVYRGGGILEDLRVLHLLF